MCDKYNGWTNQATWSVHLWLTNDQGIYNHLMEKIAEIKKNPFYIKIGDQKIKRKDEVVFAEYLKEYVEEMNPLMNSQEWLNFHFENLGLFIDLLNLALANVEFREIAINLMGD